MEYGDTIRPELETVWVRGDLSLNEQGSMLLLVHEERQEDKGGPRCCNTKVIGFSLAFTHTHTHTHTHSKREEAGEGGRSEGGREREEGEGEREGEPRTRE